MNEVLDGEGTAQKDLRKLAVSQLKALLANAGVPEEVYQGVDHPGPAIG